MTRAARSAAAAAALALLALAQSGGRALGTLSGTSVQVSGAAVDLYAAGQLVVRDGAQIALGGPAAELHLTRGGAIHLCGPARLGVAAGGGGALLLSLNAGAAELRYASPVADSLLTPDFRLSTVVPPDQLATVSAAVSLAPNGDLCVLNRGSALQLDRLAGGPSTYIINGQSLRFDPAAGAQPVATCACAAAQPAPVPDAAGPGALFPQAPPLVVNGAAPAPASPAAAPPPPRPAPRRFFLARFFRWLLGKRN